MAVESFWSSDVAGFLSADADSIGRHLAHQAQLRFRVNEAAQLRAWTAQCVILVDCLGEIPQAGGWHLLFEVSLPRTDRRADAVLLAGGTIVVLEFKIGADRFDTAARARVEDFALDLQDFHAGSRGRRIVPVLVASAATQPLPMQLALSIGGVAPVVDATPMTLAAVLAACAGFEQPPIDALINAAKWQAAPYRPVPPIIDAARALFARHNVEDIVDARAGAVSLASTSAAIRGCAGSGARNAATGGAVRHRRAGCGQDPVRFERVLWSGGRHTTRNVSDRQSFIGARAARGSRT